MRCKPIGSRSQPCSGFEKHPWLRRGKGSWRREKEGEHHLNIDLSIQKEFFCWFLSWRREPIECKPQLSTALHSAAPGCCSLDEQEGSWEGSAFLHPVVTHSTGTTQPYPSEHPPAPPAARLIQPGMGREAPGSRPG